jgi:glycosyltransferase involved in cell wall biosynthesis
VRALVVTDIPLDSGFPYGGSDRFTSFTEALAQRADVRVLYFDRVAPVRRPFVGPWQSRFDVRQVDVAENAAERSDARGRVARALHFGFDPLPLASAPRASHAVRAAAQDIDLVVTYAWRLGHLALAAPARVPVVAALDEAVERYPDPYLYANDGVVRRGMRAAERRKVQRLYERLAARRARVVAISAHEAAWFAPRVGDSLVSAIPLGIDLEAYAGLDGARDIDALVVGDLSDSRNADGVVAAVRAAPRLRWVLAGTNPRPEVAALASDTVEVCGFVADLRPLYARAGTVVVPAPRATGIKTTLLQGWAAERPVVATRPAAVGVDARDGDNLVLVDEADHIGARVEALLLDDRAARRIAAGGLATARRDHDRTVLAERFADLCIAEAGA